MVWFDNEKVSILKVKIEELNTLFWGNISMIPNPYWIKFERPNKLTKKIEFDEPDEGEHDDDNVQVIEKFYLLKLVNAMLFVIYNSNISQKMHHWKITSYKLKIRKKEYDE